VAVKHALWLSLMHAFPTSDENPDTTRPCSKPWTLHLKTSRPAAYDLHPGPKL